MRHIAPGVLGMRHIAPMTLKPSVLSVGTPLRYSSYRSRRAGSEPRFGPLGMRHIAPGMRGRNPASAL